MRYLPPLLLLALTAPGGLEGQDLAWALNQHPSLHDLTPALQQPAFDRWSTEPGYAVVYTASPRLTGSESAGCVAMELALEEGGTASIEIPSGEIDGDLTARHEIVGSFSELRLGDTAYLGGPHTRGKSVGPDGIESAYFLAMPGVVQLGYLLQMDETLALYGGVPVSARALCQHTVEHEQRCVDGTARLCAGCERMAVQLTSHAHNVGFGTIESTRSRLVDPGVADCSTPCPADGLGDTITRINDVLGSRTLYRSTRSTVQLFRTKEACEADRTASATDAGGR